jgi:hypothetical protein
MREWSAYFICSAIPDKEIFIFGVSAQTTTRVNADDQRPVPSAAGVSMTKTSPAPTSVSSA